MIWADCDNCGRDNVCCNYDDKTFNCPYCNEELGIIE